MSTCYLCGYPTSKHSSDCPKYVSLIAMTQAVVPDLKKQEFLTLKNKVSGTIWRMDKILPGQIIPAWATHGWWLIADMTWNERERKISNKNATLEELAASWSETSSEPWFISARAPHIKPGNILPMNNLPLAVFAVSSERFIKEIR